MSRRSSTTRGIPAAAWFGAQSFHTFLTAPATGRMLDSMLQDNRETDAAIERERNEDRGDEDCGSTCGAGCGYCGRCS